MDDQDDDHSQAARPHLVPTLAGTMMNPHTGAERPMTEAEQWKADRHREHITTRWQRP